MLQGVTQVVLKPGDTLLLPPGERQGGGARGGGGGGSPHRQGVEDRKGSDWVRRFRGGASGHDSSGHVSGSARYARSKLQGCASLGGAAKASEGREGKRQSRRQDEVSPWAPRGGGGVTNRGQSLVTSLSTTTKLAALFLVVGNMSH
jgi:hypothetical protein